MQKRGKIFRGRKDTLAPVVSTLRGERPRRLAVPTPLPYTVSSSLRRHCCSVREGFLSLHFLTKKMQNVDKRPTSSRHYWMQAFGTDVVECSVALPRLRTKFGERAFSHAGPATWNALPDHIRTVADPVQFRKLLKSHCFSQAFNIC